MGDRVTEIDIDQGDGLIIVDVRPDCLPGGRRGVPKGGEVVEPIRRLLALYGEHSLPVFAWREPVPHGAPGTGGAAFSKDLDLPADAVAIARTTTADAKACSAFQGTDLAQALRGRGVRRVALCGLATDYCVLDTALDALREGFTTLIVPEAMRAVDLKAGDGIHAIERMIAAGAIPVRLTAKGLVPDDELD